MIGGNLWNKKYLSKLTGKDVDHIIDSQFSDKNTKIYKARILDRIYPASSDPGIYNSTSLESIVGMRFLDPNDEENFQDIFFEHPIELNLNGSDVASLIIGNTLSFSFISDFTYDDFANFKEIAYHTPIIAYYYSDDLSFLWAMHFFAIPNPLETTDMIFFLGYSVNSSGDAVPYQMRIDGTVGVDNIVRMAISINQVTL